MKIHSLSTHHYVYGGVGEVFECIKHFWSFRVNSVSAESNTIEPINQILFV